MKIEATVFFAFLALVFASESLGEDRRCVAICDNHLNRPSELPVYRKIAGALRREKIEFFTEASATEWFSVRNDDYARARACLMTLVKSGDLEPWNIYVPEAWTKNRAGDRVYDSSHAAEIIQKEIEANTPPEATPAQRPPAPPSPSSGAPHL